MPRAVDGMKQCSKCKETKPVSEYTKSKDKPDGLRYRCKFCIKQYCADHKEKKKQYNKQYRAKNIEKIKEKKKQHYAENRECILEQKKQYYTEHKEKKKQYQRHQFPRP